MADNTLFLTPLLTACGVIAGFLGSRHQHISSLIRKKTEYIFGQYHELRTHDLSREEIQNITAQIFLFYDRNKTIEKAVYSSLTGGILFATNIVTFHFFPNTSPENQWMTVFIIPGLIALASSLCLAINEFSQSSLTLDLEIILAGSKTKPSSNNPSPSQMQNQSQVKENLLIYGDWEKKQKDLLEEADRVARKNQK